MDFVSGFPLTQQKHDSVWVIIDRLTKSAHFIPVRSDYSMDRVAELYVDEIIRLHGVPLSLCQIEIRVLHQGSGRNYGQLWALS